MASSRIPPKGWSLLPQPSASSTGPGADDINMDKIKIFGHNPYQLIQLGQPVVLSKNELRGARATLMEYAISSHIICTVELPNGVKHVVDYHELRHAPGTKEMEPIPKKLKQEVAAPKVLLKQEQVEMPVHEAQNKLEHSEIPAPVVKPKTKPRPKMGTCHFCSGSSRSKKRSYNTCFVCGFYACASHSEVKYHCFDCEVVGEIGNDSECERGTPPPRTSSGKTGKCYFCPLGNSDGKKTKNQSCIGCKKWVCGTHRQIKYHCRSGCTIVASRI